MISGRRSIEDGDALEKAFAEPRYLSEVRPDEPHFGDLDNCLSFIASPEPIKG